MHQPARFEHGVGLQEPVGCHQIDVRMVRPLRQQGLQDSRGRALSNGNTSGDADHVRHFRGRIVQEGIGRLVQRLRRRDIQVQEPGERKVDLLDHRQRDLIVQPAEREEVRFGQQERRLIAKMRPLVAREGDEARGAKAVGGRVHQTLYSQCTSV